MFSLKGARLPCVASVHTGKDDAFFLRGASNMQHHWMVAKSARWFQMDPPRFLQETSQFKKKKKRLWAWNPESAASAVKHYCAIKSLKTPQNYSRAK